MKTHDFWYDLPEELIAQTPLERRDGSRLMVLNRETGEIQHKHFYDIVNFLTVNGAIAAVVGSGCFKTVAVGINIEGKFLKLTEGYCVIL